MSPAQSRETTCDRASTALRDAGRTRRRVDGSRTRRESSSRGGAMKSSGTRAEPALYFAPSGDAPRTWMAAAPRRVSPASAPAGDRRQAWRSCHRRDSRKALPRKDLRSEGPWSSAPSRPVPATGSITCDSTRPPRRPPPPSRESSERGMPRARRAQEDLPRDLSAVERIDRQQVHEAPDHADEQEPLTNASGRRKALRPPTDTPSTARRNRTCDRMTRGHHDAGDHEGQKNPRRDPPPRSGSDESSPRPANSATRPYRSRPTTHAIQHDPGRSPKRRIDQGVAQLVHEDRHEHGHDPDEHSAIVGLFRPRIRATIQNQGCTRTGMPKSVKCRSP